MVLFVLDCSINSSSSSEVAVLQVVVLFGMRVYSSTSTSTSTSSILKIVVSSGSSSSSTGGDCFRACVRARGMLYWPPFVHVCVSGEVLRIRPAVQHWCDVYWGRQLKFTSTGRLVAKPSVASRRYYSGRLHVAFETPSVVPLCSSL